MALAERIAQHAPPIQVPLVDSWLLIKTAKRLQRSKDVVLDLPCAATKN
jgi:hypothetical protein